ncbi:hypothetical protein McanMca71_001405 [Microsporum canis]|uniref:3-oxoacyl-(Acyl-carrier-protein) reductase n=1 Tax=Arthroderma otae (strain ATCC MYA-4605 / CBS 113480) TaxID=554155 RepID=C5FU33_ARTOC|nr:3-oxoacyl-(acyl-carrier-protein) reductase [Microsporum canis CBS 113480]EEQ33417.1 3-oxoacyl-(acyl-carrier-protein) reductase [Microsporum canis CBS 113480]
MQPFQRQGARLSRVVRLSSLPHYRGLDGNGKAVAPIPQQRQLCSSHGSIYAQPSGYSSKNWLGYPNSWHLQPTNSSPLTVRVQGCQPTIPSNNRGYSTNESTKKTTVDNYIQEIEDLYAIAKDELEIAAESTAEATIYAASDRISMREAFDDLKHTYGAYADNNPPPQDIEPKDGANGVDVAEERSTAYDSTDIPDDIRAEIKRRVGHRIREIENAVNSLEESARHE